MPIAHTYVQRTCYKLYMYQCSTIFICKIQSISTEFGLLLLYYPFKWPLSYAYVVHCAIQALTDGMFFVYYVRMCCVCVRIIACNVAVQASTSGFIFTLIIFMIKDTYY